MRSDSGDSVSSGVKREREREGWREEKLSATGLKWFDEERECGSDCEWWLERVEKWNDVCQRKWTHC